MQRTMFYRLGLFVYHFRWAIIVLWFLAMIACAPFLTKVFDPFKITGFVDENASGTKTENYINEELGYTSYNKILILYSSKSLSTNNPLFISKIKKSISGLKHFPLEHKIFMPNENKKQISKDKHTAYVAVLFKSREHMSDKQLQKLRETIKQPKNMVMRISGEAIFLNDLNQQSEADICKADIIAIPMALITLILVFGSLVAASIPIVLGGGAAVVILTTLYVIGHHCTLSIFTINIALLLGLCLTLDYALFVTSRFRDELANGRDIKEAIAATQATAGKAILFSGIAVFASLSGLFLFPINILRSVAVGGLTAVFYAVFTAVILLPAVLSVLGTKVNSLSLFKRKRDSNRSEFWHWLAEVVVGRPVFFFISVFIILLMLGYPSLFANFGVSDFRVLPKESQYRYVYNVYTKEFKENELRPIVMLVKSNSGPILSQRNLNKLYDLTHKLQKNKLIDQVNSIVTTDKKMTKKQYYQLYKMSRKSMNKEVRNFLDTTTGKYFTTVTIISKPAINTADMTKLIQQLRDIKKSGFTIQFTGKPITNEELLETVSKLVPYALIWILVFTYLILLILLRSLFLPLKAILMNILSLSACYGALYMVFQEGYFAQLLNFEPQGMLDVSLLVIIFCALFGFSMDYEVFLLSRMKETYESTHDNKKSIIFGLEKSSKIITSAALIVIFTCGSFLFAEVLVVKAFGLGIAVAIFIDAFLIRSLLVPATMILLKGWNWYLPKWLNKIIPKL